MQTNIAADFPLTKKSTLKMSALAKLAALFITNMH